MNITEFNKRLTVFLDVVFSESLKSIETAAVNTMAKITTRIIETGKNAQGSQFVDYTPSYKQFKEDVGRYRGHVDFSLGSYSINKRLAAQKKRALEKHPENDLEIIPAFKARKVKAQQRTIATTSTLWVDLKLQKATGVNTGKEIRVSLAPTADVNKLKLEGFLEKRGDILTPSKDEADDAKAYIEEGMAEIANEFFP